MIVLSVLGSTALVMAGLGLYNISSKPITINGVAFDMGNSIKYVSVAAIIFALILTILVIYNITNMNISERNREIATLKVLGYKDYEMKINLSKNIEKYILKLEEQTLALKEVTVTATSGNKLNSSSSIKKAALEHVQASSIVDVMQLLPGSLTVNPNLNDISKLTIRDVTGKDATNAFGTAVIVDGARMSNDANMQMTSTALSNQGISTSAGTGIDARQIAVDNIESIEVIRGIASAEYGDLNSGAVIVKTKAGKSPLEVRFKTDPKIKQVYAGKGFALGDNKGFLNIDADYVQSQNDIRTPAKSYNRLTAQIGYSNVFNPQGRAFSLNAKLKGLTTLDKQKSDPDKQSEEKTKVENQEISLNIYGNWMINKAC